MRVRARSIFAWVMLVAGVSACIAAAYGAYTLAGYAWNQVVEYKSPYVRQPGAADTSPTPVWVPPALQPSATASSAPLAQRVVLVIIDGLRDDVSRTEMSALARLRTYGSDIVLTVPQPSLSYPNWTTILTGAPQDISGVTTNWFEGRVPAPTLMDMAEQRGRRVAVVGPEDFAELYGVRPGPSVSLRPWPKGGYLSSTLIDDALRIADTGDPELIVIHLPDLDEAGHEYGGDSREYRDVAQKIDTDLSRLIDGLQRVDTAFVVVADHGHIDGGGHGGWEPAAIRIPSVFAGAGTKLGSGEGSLEQVASTIAILSGIPVPPYAAQTALTSAIATTSASVFRADDRHHVSFVRHYHDVVNSGVGTSGPTPFAGSDPRTADGVAEQAVSSRQAAERESRGLLALVGLGVALLAILLIGLSSWRALVSAIAGTFGYYALYSVLFFGIHRYNWSLSAFNTETNVRAFMNGRMIEAVAAGLFGAAVAAMVYPVLRKLPSGPREPGFASSWLALGAATVIAIQATLGIQVAWYYWYYGMQISWVLPDFMWAFKTDLDMVQATALGAAALLAPLVTYAVGRYHPRVARVRAGGEAVGSKT